MATERWHAVRILAGCMIFSPQDSMVSTYFVQASPRSCSSIGLTARDVAATGTSLPYPTKIVAGDRLGRTDDPWREIYRAVRLLLAWESAAQPEKQMTN